MNKAKKTVSVVLIALFLAALSNNIILATDFSSLVNSVASSTTASSMNELGGLETPVANIMKAIRVIGVVIAIGSLTYMGIKYMMGSVEQKAEYKKTMIPYAVGAVLVGAAPTIVTKIVSFVQGQ